MSILPERLGAISTPAMQTPNVIKSPKRPPTVKKMVFNVGSHPANKMAIKPAQENTESEKKKNVLI